MFVLGGARSGSAAVARLLARCGAALPAMPGDARTDDMTGGRQLRTPRIINDKILRRHGSSGVDPTLRLQDESTFDVEEREACVAEMKGFLAGASNAPFVVINDPRVSQLFGLWSEAAAAAGFDVAVVIVVRHPSEVVTSVAVGGAALPELSSALWLKANLLAEIETRGMVRVFVDYANLLQDWRRELERISVALGVELDTGDEAAIERSLKSNPDRQRDCGSVADLAGANWISQVHEELFLAARDEPWDQSVLDHVFAAYQASERSFRPVFAIFEYLDKMNPHVRPSVMKMIDRARVTANRRRITGSSPLRAGLPGWPLRRH
ncbi:sulfotransferase family protein [Mycobacterium vicinigordonae]|uniref:Sulfotransferase family protein n=1 Tax=Mycobacterium vicinigordonae TaxID=1719132 RepID=A0A7D6E5G3_9MYCO|nr:sulfotransferase family protein [Mycobacterium vicinigordonae]QLL07802.1 sulfotransferase family protein [Mycobacterium vicinigordonae]